MRVGTATVLLVTVGVVMVRVRLGHFVASARAWW